VISAHVAEEMRVERRVVLAGRSEHCQLSVQERDMPPKQLLSGPAWEKKPAGVSRLRPFA
jgi:hypothetical protein